MRNERTIARARLYRKEQTATEARLWSYLRARRFGGAKFRRQHAIGPYAVDFACVAARLIVEADGPSHQSDEQIAFDQVRTEFLERAGWRVLRIPNDLVRINIGVVGKAIEEALNASPSPPRGGEGGA